MNTSEEERSLYQTVRVATCKIKELRMRQMPRRKTQSPLPCSVGVNSTTTVQRAGYGYVEMRLEKGLTRWLKQNSFFHKHMQFASRYIIEGIQVVSIASIASKSLTPEPLIPTTMERLSLILNKSGLETLGALDVDGLDVRVELLGGSLLVVTLAGDADAKSEWASLDTGLPDLLVQLWVDADISGTLDKGLVFCRIERAYSTVF